MSGDRQTFAQQERDAAPDPLGAAEASGAAGVADELLLSRLRSGDEAALSALYRRHVQAIYRFVLGQVRDHDAAEDLTSDTFARMLRGVEGYRGEASFKNWLYQIARNAVRNHRRSASYRLNVPLSPALPASEPESEPVATRDAEARVAAMLAPLPPRYRQVLELRFLLGCSLQETADRLAITVANAKVLQLRALQKLGRQTGAAAEPASSSRPIWNTVEIEETDRGSHPV
ncbi:MAG: RNA polymerase sigma factor [Anaerolineae bacterium]|jgi:RNA polymerase sigma-70 factor (ECF subfamily)|nr:RNA polymerase sigma factor [Ardenticatenia bacterium]HQZ70747.1 RNA polymerase sigma factor [Anaerolineae bacterium]HRA19525.1 RNA polymerase sigma factor [Anaerolineae bacterium]